MAAVLFKKDIEKMEEWLQDHPDDINIIMNYYTPLKKAVVKGNLITAKFLIDKGADMSNCLLYASGSNDIDMRRLLLDKGADIDEDPILFNAIGDKENHRIALDMYLLIYGYDWNLPIKYAMKILLGCTYSNNINLVNEVIDYYDPHDYDNNVMQNVIDSSTLDDEDKIKFMQILVDHGGFFSDVRPTFSLTINILRYILSHGWDINSVDKNGNTILHLLYLKIKDRIFRSQKNYFNGSLENLDDLLRGVENIQQDFNINYQEYIDTAVFVVNSGIDQNIRNGRNYTPNDILSSIFQFNWDYDDKEHLGIPYREHEYWYEDY